MTTREKFLALIEAYLARTGMSAREFGVQVRNDTDFVYGLRRGRSINADTIDKVEAWIAKHPLAF